MSGFFVYLIYQSLLNMSTFKKEIDPLNSFWENYNFIIKSLNEYNKGDESETKRIAVSLRSLFHSPKSILNQIGKNDLELYDSRLVKFSFSYNVFEGMNLDIVNLNKKNLPYYALNCRRFFKKDGQYLLKNYPLYAHTQYKFDKAKKVKFVEWWEQEIFDNLQGDTLNRRQIVTNVSNKEGVAHLD